VAIQGPPGRWALEYLELATHHGNTSGVHYLLVLPAASERYVRPAVGWIIATWLTLTAVLLLPAPVRLPRWIRLLYAVVAGLVVLELTLSVVSPWLSDYRIVFSASTFALWLILLLAPRLWDVGRLVVRRTLVSPPGATDAERGVMARRRAWVAVALVLSACSLTAAQLFRKGVFRIGTGSERGLATSEEPSVAPVRPPTPREIRQALLDELRPVALENCTLRRFGGPNDGGYLVCDNLIAGAASAYSYGIAGEDNWGCDVSRGFGIPVHQYDCFDTRQPVCEGGRFVFHPECIGGEPATIESRPFDTLTNQIAKNGDAGKRLIVKMDVEGAEWDSLLATPDEVLVRIEQIPMELHGTDDPRFLDVVRKLKRTFYLVHIHFNNMACTPAVEPFPAFAFQVLFVNKRIGRLDALAPDPTLPNPADAPDNPGIPDCQR
jgi:hypothetical protein